MTHTSACAVHNMPAYPNGPCNCGEWAREEARKAYLKCHWKREHDEPIIAAALIAAERRGRAQGMREAAEIAAYGVRWFPEPSKDTMHYVRETAWGLARSIRARADAIERGE